MRPMLAKKYANFKNRLEFPLFVQPKLNGVRGIYNARRFQSRDEKLWADPVVAHVVEALEKVPDHVILDGEFYVHGWSLQKINSAISVNRNEPAAATSAVQYHIFDCVVADKLELSFAERNNFLRTMLSNQHTSIVLVPTYYVNSDSEASHYHAIFKDVNYEGSIYRLDEPYGLAHECSNKENRWHRLLKRKDWLDEDCEVVDVELGKSDGKYADLVGSLVLRFTNGQLFRAGSGLSDLQRHMYLDRPPIGKMVKIKYEMLSDDGVPLKPTIEAVLD